MPDEDRVAAVGCVNKNCKVLISGKSVDSMFAGKLTGSNASTTRSLAISGVADDGLISESSDLVSSKSLRMVVADRGTLGVALEVTVSPVWNMG